MADNKNGPADLSRRQLLKSAAVAGAVLAGHAAVAPLAEAQASTTPAPVPAPALEALETLTAAEADTLEALVDRILPSDENGPGAREARAAHYIDRSLASDNLQHRETYLIGLSALDDYAQERHGQRFHLLPAATQDAVIEAMIAGEVPGLRPSGGGFFNLVRNHTIDGCFSDPYYGGNRNFVGWDLLGYPGVRVAVSEADVAAGRALAPNHQSAYDVPTFTKIIVSTGGAGHGH